MKKPSLDPLTAQRQVAREVVRLHELYRTASRESDEAKTRVEHLAAERHAAEEALRKFFPHGERLLLDGVIVWVRTAGSCDVETPVTL